MMREHADEQRFKLEAEIQRLLACRFLDHIKNENAKKESSFMKDQVEASRQQLQKLEEEQCQRMTECQEEMETQNEQLKESDIQLNEKDE